MEKNGVCSYFPFSSTIHESNYLNGGRKSRFLCMKSILRNYHPIFFALYAVLALIAVNINISQMSLAEGIRPLIAGGLLGLLIVLACKSLIRNMDQAALAATWNIIAVFFYGHFYEIFENSNGIFSFLGHHRYLLPVWLGFWILGLWLILRKAWDSRNINRILNWISLAMVTLSLVQIGWYEYQGWLQKQQEAKKASLSPIAGSPGAEYQPDIYYIILDSYMRDDALTTYGFDNSDFLQELSSLGFYVATCSQSNYATTPFSLSSSLNMDYLDKFAPSEFEKKANPITMRTYIRHSRVREEFNQLGYQFVAMESGVPWKEIVDADLYILSKDPEPEGFAKFLRISEFEMIFLRTTIMRIVVESKGVLPQSKNPVFKTPEQTHYELVTSVLDQLKDLHTLPGPKFVFAHIVSPHFPYVFGNDGEYQLSRDFDPGYFDNIRYLNQRILEIARSLIENSPLPPVIIIQADHGWTPEYRMAILNAYYLPKGGVTGLYPQISPVNSFRVVLNEYFDKDLGLLPDVSYFSVNDKKIVYDFEIVEYPCEEDR